MRLDYLCSLRQWEIGRREVGLPKWGLHGREQQQQQGELHGADARWEEGENMGGQKKGLLESKKVITTSAFYLLGKKERIYSTVLSLDIWKFWVINRKVK